MEDNGRGSSAWADAGAVLDRAIEAGREAWTADGAADGAPADPASIVNQAALIAFSGGLRYWSEVAALCAGRNGVLMRTLLPASKDLADAERQRMIDDLRGLARDIGDLALREARRLQVELDALAQRLAAGEAEPAPAPAPRRYARAKP